MSLIGDDFSDHRPLSYRCIRREAQWQARNTGTNTSSSSRLPWKMASWSSSEPRSFWIQSTPVTSYRPARNHERWRWKEVRSCEALRVLLNVALLSDCQRFQNSILWCGYTIDIPYIIHCPFFGFIPLGTETEEILCLPASWSYMVMEDIYKYYR